jgi:hypothetical protein
LMESLYIRYSSSNEKRKTIDGVLFIRPLTLSERIMSETPLIVFFSLSLGEGRGEVWGEV